MRAETTDERLFLSIMRMLRLDQNARDLAAAFDNEQGPAYRKMVEVDDDNLVQLKKIIATHGLPSPGEVGDTGANAMLMMVAHADRDLSFQKSAAQDMDNQVARGSLPAMYPAVLKSIRPQITGAAEVATTKAVQARQDAYKTAQECYNTTYRKSFYSYLRQHYPAAG